MTLYVYALCAAGARPGALRGLRSEPLRVVRWGRFGAVVGRVDAAPRPSLMHPSAGYTFSWTGYLGASQEGLRIMRFRVQEKRSDRVEGEMAYDQKVVAPDLGVFFPNVIS